ncbi:MAG: NAD(+) synthase [Candidatus Riflebacteria bacterium]|nr:NAD(+) synthase [Candidatus Riflebacteria bacterium]
MDCSSSNAFFSIYSHGFVKVAVCIPVVFPGEPDRNADGIIALAKQAAENNAVLAVFPELSISGYSNEDLFQQKALLNASENAIVKILEASKNIRCLIIAGCPIFFSGTLYNCALAVCNGDLIAAWPKTYLPNYREFYEKRQFTCGTDAAVDTINFAGKSVPFGSNILLCADNFDDFVLHTEICEDLWAPIPPSSFAALAGATVIANLSASNITIGKADYRKQLCSAHSAATVSAYIYSAAGEGESSTDLAWDGHGGIYENGTLLSETERFSMNEKIIFADLDLERLSNDRMRFSTFQDSKKNFRDQISKFRRINFELILPEHQVLLNREIKRFPFVPVGGQELDERCSEAYRIQLSALTKRMQSSGIMKIIIGISGGLDSTHALIVAAKVVDRLKISRKNIIAVTMPGFGTTQRTKSNAISLMESLGVTALEIDIKPSCRQMLDDIKHPAGSGEKLYDVTFENVQAGERTSHLFRLANFHNGIVLGTGDLSELALGWCTYGVGDHMSHYNVNASVPKTLIQHLIRWVISKEEFDAEVNTILQSIIETEISPELIPSDEDSDSACDSGNSGTKSAAKKDSQPGQKTEEIIGPYELHDFFLYYTTRFGYSPDKTAFLAFNAWKDKTTGKWPLNFPEIKKHEYSIQDIKKWLGKFLFRFFQTSQFKRSCVPNSPKVGSGGSLSPRGDWRAPSDMNASIWLKNLADKVPEN